MSWNIDEAIYPGPDESRGLIDVETVTGIAMDIAPQTISRWILYNNDGKIVASGESAPTTMSLGDTLTFTPSALTFTI